MKKLFLTLFCSIVIFQTSAMQYRVAAKKMHERVQKQSRSYKVPEQQLVPGEPREAHRPSLGYAGPCSWRTQLIGAALCTMLLCAEAAPVFAQARSNPHVPRSQEDDTSSCHTLDQFGKTALDPATYPKDPDQEADELASREDLAHLDSWAAHFVEGGY